MDVNSAEVENEWVACVWVGIGMVKCMEVDSKVVTCVVVLSEAVVGVDVQRGTAVHSTNRVDTSTRFIAV